MGSKFLNLPSLSFIFQFFSSCNLHSNLIIISSLQNVSFHWEKNLFKEDEWSFTFLQQSKSTLKNEIVSIVRCSNLTLRSRIRFSATLKLRCDERFTHAFSNKLHWLAQTKVITLKTQLHAVNAR
jgi:hypothetical protein